MKYKTKESFFKKKFVTFAFALISLLGGFLFLNSNITGNVIVIRPYPVSIVSLVGLLLILCSAILFAYSIKKK